MATIELALPRGALDAIIRNVRNRWRLRVALHGLTILLGAVFVALLVGSWVMERFRFAPFAVTGVRLAVYVFLAVIAARYLVRPLIRRVSDDRVALYLEEREPSLDTAVLTAVEASMQEVPNAVRSPNLVARLVDGAVARARAIGNGERIERRSVTSSTTAIAAIFLGGLLLIVMGPDPLRNGTRLLATPWDLAAEKRPYMILVQPGSAEVTRGGDVAIHAALQGFISDDIELIVRRGTDSIADSATRASQNDAGWERLPMGAGRDSGEFELRLFDLRSNTSYYVESNGVRTPIFQLSVVDLPYVAELDFEYRYPASTCLNAEKVKNAGDIAAPRGTSVLVRATVTKPVKGGRIVLEGRPPIPLILGPDGALTGALPVSASGFYKIELEALNGAMVAGSLDYTIDALEDNDPTISFRKPGRDQQPSSIEEVFTEAEATDDYGVAKMDIRYSVNGGAEQVVSLYGNNGCRKQALAGHTFFLEQMGLQPGDLVAYYAQATDNGRHVAKTDIYFLNIRPFERQFRQAPSPQSGGQQQQQQEQQQPSQPPSMGELSRRQRDIIAGTFKVDRDQASLSPAAQRENLAVLLTSQRKLREQADTLVHLLVMRGIVGTDSAFQIVADALPKATAEMKLVEEQFEKRNVRAALAPEQRALQHLQRAEAAYREFQVRSPQQASSSSSSGQQQDQPPAEDLADLFELKDEVPNAYQTDQPRGPQSSQAAEKVIDETAEKLKQLVARQQAENERRNRANARQQQQQQSQQQQGQQQQGQQQRGQQQQGQQQQDQQQQDQQQQGQQAQQRMQSASSGQSQRQLAEQTEQVLKQLEKAARERPEDRELRESVRRLQESAKSMRRAATDPNDRGAAQSASALDALNDARRLLEAQRQGRGERAAEEAVRLAERIASAQKTIEQIVKQAESAGGSKDGDYEQRLRERKDGLGKAIGELQSRLNELAQEAQPTQPAAAGKLKATAEDIRQSGIQDRVSYAKAVMRGSGAQAVFEEQLSEDTDKLRRQVAEAAKSLRGRLGQNEEQGQSKSEELIDRARDLVQGLESLQERTRQQQEQQQQRSGQSAQASKRNQADSSQSVQDARQFAREYQEQRQAAETLQQDARQRGLARNAKDLEPTIEQMRTLEDLRAYKDPAQMALLQAAMLERAKEWEFSLRQRLVKEDLSRPQLGGTSDVPDEYRALVAEYYRALAKKR